MVFYKTPPPVMYRRKMFIYLRTTAETIRKYKRQFNLKNDCYAFISKKDEDKCKKPMIIYNNILETENFEKKKKEVLERNKTRHGKRKCKITFSEKANEEFAFLIQNVEFTESKLRAAAREMKMGLHEFMAYYSHKKKLRNETKAKKQVVHLRHKHRAAKRGIGRENERTKKIPQSMQERLHFHAYKKSPTQKNNKNNSTHSTSDASEEELAVLHPGVLSFDQSGKFSNSVEDIHSFTEKIKSSKIAAAPNENTENEFYKKKKEIIREGEDLYSYPEVLPRKKIKQELRVCLTNIDREISRMQHTRTHTVAKRKIEEKTRKIPQKRLIISMPSTEKIKNDNTHPPSDEGEKEINLLHPDVCELSFDQPGKLLNSVEEIHSFKEKMESSEIAAISSENTKNEFCKKKEEIVPEKVLPGRKIQDDLHVCVTNTDVEVTRAQHTRCFSHTAVKRKIEGKTEKTRKIPRSLHKRVSMQMHSTEKNKNNTHPPSDASEKEIPLLHPGVSELSFDQPGNFLNSVENIHSFKEKIESTEIATAPSENYENEFCKKKDDSEREDLHLYIYPEELSGGKIQEDPYVRAQQVAKELASMYTSAESVCVAKKSTDVEVSHAQHTDSKEAHTAAEREIEGGETERTMEIPQSVQEGLDFYTHITEKSKNDNLHPPSDASEKEITVLHPDVLFFDQPEKLSNSVEDIQHVFQSTEIADASSEITENEFCKMGGKKEERQREIISEDTLQHYFSEKLSLSSILSQEDLHTYIEESSGREILPGDYVCDTFEKERDEISGGYFSLSFPPLSDSRQYQDISNDCDLSLPDDHTYGVCDNYAPCSVEDKAPVLQSESIVEFAPILSDFTVHPPFNNKVDKTIVFGTLNTHNTVSLSSVYENSDEVFVFDENEWKEKDMHEISECPSKQNDQYSNNSKQIGQPPSNSVPIYDAASFYDMMSSEILEDKILEK